MMRNRLYTKDEVIQVVEAALNALNNQSAPAREPEHLDNSTSQQSSPGTKMTLSVREAAELIGISKPKMYELIHSNEIPSIHVGKKIDRPTGAHGLAVGRRYEWQESVLTAKEPSENGLTEAGKPDTVPMENGIRSMAEPRRKSGRN